MTDYRAQIAAAAQRYGLEVNLLNAQVLVESGGDTEAFRFEPQFYERYIRSDPRALARRFGPLAACSFGLLQVMLETAYERGFRGLPHQLFDPAIGLEWGARHLAALLIWARKSGNPEDVCLRAALAAYNGGRSGNEADDRPDRNAAYAAKVLATRDQLTT